MFPYFLWVDSSARPALRRLAVAFPLCLAFAAPLAQAGEELSLDQALSLAEMRSRQLLAEDASAAAARSMALSAGAFPDPVLKAGVNNLPVDGVDRFSLTRDFMTMRSIGIAQELTRADKRMARSARFEREAELAEAERGRVVLELRGETAAAWLDRYFQERLRDLLRELRVETALQVEAAEAAYAGKRGMQVEVLAARTAVALTDDRLEEVESRLTSAQVRLARWIGAAADRTLAPPPALDRAWLDATDVDALLERHPRLAVMLREEDVARAEVAIARSSRRPDWSVELSYSQRGPAFSNMASLGVSIPLHVDPAQRQDRDIAAKVALADRIRDQREEARREISAAIRSDILRWRSNRGRLARFDRSLLPLAAERVSGETTAYRGGASSLASALAARRLEIDTRLERLRLEMDTAALWARLEYLLPAADLPATPNPPSSLAPAAPAQE
ncbi:MAG: TolC family protein [Lautropia sp.]